MTLQQTYQINPKVNFFKPQVKMTHLAQVSQSPYLKDSYTNQLHLTLHSFQNSEVHTLPTNKYQFHYSNKWWFPALWAHVEARQNGTCMSPATTFQRDYIVLLMHWNSLQMHLHKAALTLSIIHLLPILKHTLWVTLNVLY